MNRIFTGTYMLTDVKDGEYSFEALQQQEFNVADSGKLTLEEAFIATLADRGYNLPDGHLEVFIKAAHDNDCNFPVGIRKPWPEDLRALGKIEPCSYSIRPKGMLGQTLSAHAVEVQAGNAAKLLQFCVSNDERKFEAELKSLSCDLPKPDSLSLQQNLLTKSSFGKSKITWSKLTLGEVKSLIDWANEKLSNAQSTSSSTGYAAETPQRIEKMAGLVGWWLELKVSVVPSPKEKKANNPTVSMCVPNGILLSAETRFFKTTKIIGCPTEDVIKGDFYPLKRDAHIEGYHYFVPSQSPELQRCKSQRWGLNSGFNEKLQRSQNDTNIKAITWPFAEIGNDSLRPEFCPTEACQSGALLFIPNRFDAAYFEVFKTLPLHLTEVKRGFEIPKIIHRFWAGGKMSEATVKNLKSMQDGVKNTGWKHFLWTSKTVNEQVAKTRENALATQMEDLTRHGIEVNDVADLTKNRAFAEHLTARIAKAIEGLSKEKPDYVHVKYLSDFVRLVATYENGGVYMDTDIGPGSVPWRKTVLYHRDEEGEVPLAGIQVQNTQEFKKTLVGPGTLEKNMLNNTINKTATPLFNYFYATRAKTNSNRAALMYMVTNLNDGGMSAATAHFKCADERPCEWLVPWIAELEWATDASDVEEGGEEKDEQ
jgi:hypothetical protein